MSIDKILAEFSSHRLNGEPVPDDLKALLANHEDLMERTGIELNWKKKWAPWLDTSYLSAKDLENPGIAANVKAIAEVCGLIAFVGAEEDGNYFGYWRGTGNRPIAKSPLVCLDNEGQFRMLAGSTLAEAILVEKTYGSGQFTEFRQWLGSLGIKIGWKTPDDATYPKVADRPKDLHKEIYNRLMGK